MRTRRAPLVALAALFALAASPPVFALTDEEIFRDLRFNFINPGGRSLGMGGAFISLADDATATQANPSGLTTLLSPQFFLEFRAANPDSTTTARGFRDPFLPDEGFDVLVRTDAGSSISPSFVSYCYPWSRVAIGFSRQEVIGIDNTTSNRFDFLLGDQSDVRLGEGAIELELTNWNASLAVTAHERLRLGMTVSYGTLRMESTIVNTYVDPGGGLIGDPNLAGVPFEMYRTEADDRDGDLTLTAGLLWSVTDTIGVGAVWRQGGDFSIEQTLVARTIDQGLIPGQITSQVFFNESDTFVTSENEAYTFANEFHVPDVIGVGVSWRPLAALTVALDGVMIRYDDLLEGFNSRLNVLTAGFPDDASARFTLDDRTNLHLGVEYVLPSERPTRRVILRGGWHQDRDNRLRSDFAPGGFGLGSNENFPGRSDADHVSFGVGFVTGNNFQLDTAIDHSSVGTEGVVSMIYKF